MNKFFEFANELLNRAKQLHSLVCELDIDKSLLAREEDDYAHVCDTVQAIENGFNITNQNKILNWLYISADCHWGTIVGMPQYCPVPREIRALCREYRNVIVSYHNTLRESVPVYA